MKFVIIPAYNEEQVIGEVARRAVLACPNTVVVDDSSTDATTRGAREAGAYVLRHAINRGQGAAWMTGIKYALGKGAKAIVLMDADGQHKAEDIERIAEPILSGRADVVIGVRDFSSNMPFFRRIYNTIANWTTYLFFGAGSRDTQSGFRALSAKAAEQMDLKTNSHEVCTEMFGEIKRLGLRLEEVCIETIYTPYSMSKGQGPKTGAKTFLNLVIHKIIK